MSRRTIDLRPVDANDPLANLTLPPALTDVQFERFVAHKLDEHFAPKADELMHHALECCRLALEAGCQTLAFNYARAAAHWRQVMEDRQRADVVVAAELVEDAL